MWGHCDEEGLLNLIPSSYDLFLSLHCTQRVNLEYGEMSSCNGYGP